MQSSLTHRLPMPTTIAAVLAGMILAVFLGYMAAIFNLKFLLVFFLILAGGGVCLWLGKRVWLLIPFTGGFGGTITFLPLPFTISEMAQLMVAGVFVMFIIFRRLPARNVPDPLDLVIFLNLAYLATVFIRNPVGVAAIGSERVGGRPYLMIVVATLSYLIFSHVRLEGRLARWYPLIGLSSALIGNALYSVTFFAPSLAPFVYPFYSGIDISGVLTEMTARSGPAPNVEVVERIPWLSSMFLPVAIVLMGYFRPFSLLTPARLWPCVLFVAAVGAVLMGGYRGAIVKIGFYFAVASIIWGGGRDLVKSAFIGALAVLSLLMIHQSFWRLPQAAQRALTIVPGNWDWDPVVLDDSRGSSEWRKNMWRDLLEGGDMYIRNWALGDGFGFTALDLELMQRDVVGASGGLGSSDETVSQKISGAYHNGPLSAVRYVGIVGFLLLLVLYFVNLNEVRKLLPRARGTPYMPAAILLCCGAVYTPLNFVIIFGAFDVDFAMAISGLGVTKMLKQSLRDYLAPSPEPERLADVPRAEAPVPMAFRKVQGRSR